MDASSNWRREQSGTTNAYEELYERFEREWQEIAIKFVNEIKGVSDDYFGSRGAVVDISPKR